MGGSTRNGEIGSGWPFPMELCAKSCLCLGVPSQRQLELFCLPLRMSFQGEEVTQVDWPRALYEEQWSSDVGTLHAKLNTRVCTLT